MSCANLRPRSVATVLVWTRKTASDLANDIKPGRSTRSPQLVFRGQARYIPRTARGVSRSPYAHFLRRSGLTRSRDLVLLTLTVVTDDQDADSPLMRLG